MKKLLFSILLCFVFIGVVSAEEYVHTFEASTVNVAITEISGPSLKMVISGLPSSTSFDSINVLFVDSATAGYGTISTNADGCATSSLSYDNNDFNKWHTAGHSGYDLGEVNNPSFIYPFKKYGYVYVMYSVYESGKHQCYVTNKAVQINKPELKAINARYTVAFSGANLSVTKLFPYVAKGSYNMKTKIGLITNDSIIEKLKNGDASVYSEIVTYAKSASDSDSFVLTYLDNASSAGQIDVSKLSLNGIYFIYTYFENTTDLREIDGITIAQAQRGSSSTVLETDPTKIDYSLYSGSHEAVNPPAEEPSGENPTNPSTGLTISIGALLLFLISILIITKKSSRKFYRV